MSDFNFLQDSSSGKWVVKAPKRSKRPNQEIGKEPPCPFEPTGPASQRGEQAQGKPGNQESIFEINQARVIPNKYPFAPIHEIIIHSDDHHKNFDQLELSLIEDLLNVYRSRFDLYKDKGQVYIFHNQGKNAGESLPHPHTQLVVIPDKVKLEIPILSLEDEEVKQLNHYYMFCPIASQWPDEVWVAPKREGRFFYESTDEEIKELAFILSRLVQIFDLRHGHDFAFNFYIAPFQGWYLRLIPRLKIIGGFEVGTNVFVNTGDPVETIQFIKTHFDNPDFDLIKKEHLAEYERSA